jgi:hypothetical protein
LAGKFRKRCSGAIAILAVARETCGRFGGAGSGIARSPHTVAAQSANDGTGDQNLSHHKFILDNC